MEDLVTQKHLRQGNSLPPLQNDKLRLYSMRFCPYAYRTRMVLAHKNIPYETVNVNLREKPDWFVKRNPRGMVPALEKNGQVIYESTICSEYLDEQYKDNPVYPHDAFEKARCKVLLSHFDTWATNMVKFLMEAKKKTKTISEYEMSKMKEDMHNEMQILEIELETKPFFGGAQPGILDYHIWPFLESLEWAAEQFKTVTYNGYENLLLPDKYPNMMSWMMKMTDNPVVKKTSVGEENYTNYIKSFITGKVPDYDTGL